MNKTYTHLSHFKRSRIFEWKHYKRLSIREISRRLNRSHTTISRELKRNTHRQYAPLYAAQRIADYRVEHNAVN